MDRLLPSRFSSAFLPFSACLEDEGKTREEYDRLVLNECRERQVELVVLAGWMRVLSSTFINNYINKVINLHPALPGKYPGTNAVKRA